MWPFTKGRYSLERSYSSPSHEHRVRKGQQRGSGWKAEDSGREEALEANVWSRLELGGSRVPISFITGSPELELFFCYVFFNIFVRSRPHASTIGMMLGGKEN